jgi:hypothetical protein
MSMDSDKITLGTLIARKDGAVGVVTHIANDDDPAVPASAPVRVRFKDEGAMIRWPTRRSPTPARPPSA